jgi:YaiO family outer membrane protein
VQRLTRAFVAVALLAAPAQARAACSFTALPLPNVQVQTGYSGDELTGGRGAWNESYAQIVDRAGTRNAAYVRAADDRRFGAADPSYEGGAYVAIAPRILANVDASYSPTHQFLADDTLSGSVDIRTGGGYGVQAGYSQRNYPLQIVGITTAGVDRYTGDDRLSAGVSLVRLNTAGGIAVVESAGYERAFPCDTLRVNVSAGRDVEPTGVGSTVAIFKSFDYDAGALHWFSSHLAVDAGAGWYILQGAYNRFEVRIALRGRL